MASYEWKTTQEGYSSGIYKGTLYNDEISVDFIKSCI